jgi:hypothetical protein
MYTYKFKMRQSADLARVHDAITRFAHGLNQYTVKCPKSPARDAWLTLYDFRASFCRICDAGASFKSSRSSRQLSWLDFGKACSSGNSVDLRFLNFNVLYDSTLKPSLFNAPTSQLRVYYCAARSTARYRLLLASMRGSNIGARFAIENESLMMHFEDLHVSIQSHILNESKLLMDVQSSTWSSAATKGFTLVAPNEWLQSWVACFVTEEETFGCLDRQFLVNCLMVRTAFAPITKVPSCGRPLYRCLCLN